MRPAPMKLYLSGPMTGIPKHNFPAFEFAMGRLMYEGHQVVSPHMQEGDEEHGKSADGFSVTPELYDELLARDYALIEECDGIVFLPGWEDSGGAGREGEHALKHGLTLYTFHPEMGRKYDSSIITLNPKRFKALRTIKRVERETA